MQMPNAQGLAGLMSQGRAPQQPQQPMPSPNKASPMAGLGSVEDRVAAYRGNPAPLQQRYQMSQDLLDLLALQKIKSEKEAAARDMQLKLGQQQAAQGMEPQTIAQQREKEVMELTKNELAQQRGETAQQQQAQQQGAMQRLMSGIAAAPGAAAAAQPKAMASGGIVAFAGDDERVGSEVPSPEVARILNKHPRERTPEDNAILEQAGYKLQRQVIPADSAISRLNTALGGRRPAAVLDQERERNMQIARAQGENLRPTMANDPRLLAPIAAETPAGPAAPAPAGPAAPTAPRPAAPAAPAPAAPAAAPATAGLPGLVDKTSAEMMQRDPQAEQRAMEERIQRMYALSPEQRAVFEQGIAQRQKMFDETYDPERQRQEGIKRFLIGAGGRRYGELGGGAASAMAYDEGRRVQKLKDFGEMQKAREGLVGLEREGIKPSIEGGLKSLEVGESGRRVGLDAGTRRVEGALDRESREKIAADNNRIQGMIAQATREQTLELRRGALMQDINKTETRALSDLQKGPIAKSIANLEQIKSMNPKGFAKEQQQQLDDLNRQLQDAEDAVRAQMDVYREQLGGFTGKGSAKSGYKVTEITPGKK